MYQAKDQRLSAYELLVHYQVEQHQPLVARINKDETEYKDEWYGARWFGADRCDGGVVLITQWYGRACGQHNETVLWYGDLESTQDRTYQTLLERLKHARFKALTENEQGFSKIQQTA